MSPAERLAFNLGINVAAGLVAGVAKGFVETAKSPLQRELGAMFQLLAGEIERLALREDGTIGGASPQPETSN